MNKEENRLFYHWDEVMRRDNTFWNKGFYWGCLCGFIIGWIIITLVGLYLD